MIQLFHILKRRNLPEVFDAQLQSVLARLEQSKERSLSMLGFGNVGSPMESFRNVGYLGWDHAYKFCKNNTLFMSHIASRGSSHARSNCPFVTVSIEITEILGDLWQIGSGCKFVIEWSSLILTFSSVHVQ